ncbi:spindle and kinetochore-associated protein 2 [Fagus crenata]
MVQHRLEKEFQQENPMKLLSRIKKVQEDLLTLKEQCHELLKAKQDLIDKARTTLVGKRTLLQQMQASVGIPFISDSDDSAFANFNQIVDEGEAQVRSKTVIRHEIISLFAILVSY